LNFTYAFKSYQLVGLTVAGPPCMHSAPSTVTDVVFSTHIITFRNWHLYKNSPPKQAIYSAAVNSVSFLTVLLETSYLRMYWTYIHQIFSRMVDILVIWWDD